MRSAGCLLLLAVLAAGCTQTDENPNWNPQVEYPAWTYDAPFYYRPSEDLPVAETLGAGVEIYYTRRRCFFLAHPKGYQVVGEPRLGVWCSTDEGRHWQRCGYYGVEQTHFLFQAESDGRHWIRFVGPGQGVSDTPPGMPHRIYVVDTQPAQILLTVRPSPWSDEENRVPHLYRVGDAVQIAWAVCDVNLRAESVKLGTCFAKFPHNLTWSRFPEPLAPTGRIDVEIPPEAVREGGLRFRMTATDKAGNVALGFTDVLHVYGPAGEAPPRSAPLPPGALQEARRALPPDPRPGWPMPGALLRGGTNRVLKWLPEAAARYKTLQLQFSADNGRSWRTIASGFQASQAVAWTVPNLASKNCRLRILAVPPGGEPATKPAAEPAEEPRRLLLAMTQRFTVTAIAPDTVIPPPDKPIPVAPNGE